MPNRPAHPPATSDPDGATKVAFKVLETRLASEYQLRQLAEAALKTARQALIGLGQDLLGDFEEVHKTELPTMGEPEIAKLIYWRVQQKITEQVAVAVKHAHATASKAAAAPAPVVVIRDVPARALPVAAAPALPSPPPEPPEDWSSAPPASVAASPAPAVVMESEPTSSPATPTADEEEAEAGTVLEIADFVPYTADFQPAAPPATWPTWFADWMDQWSTESPKDFTILQILGRTGEPYRSTVAATAAQLLNLQSGRSGSIGRAVDRLIEVGWLTREEVQWQSKRLHLVALSDQGLDAYRQLFGATPAPQVLTLMLARHSSAQHVYLILEAQRLLEAAGYAVERFPAGSETPDGMVYPDLVAAFEGRNLYIEVETVTSRSKSGPERHAKWARYRELTNGQFYLVTANKTGSRALLSELRYWAQHTNQTFDAYVLELSRGPGSGWEIWQHSTIPQ